MVSYENRTTGGFFEKKTGHIYFKEDNLLHAISKLRYVQFHVVVVPTTRDQKTRQVVAYKRSAPISGRRRLQERFQDLTGWVLVFWIGGRTWRFNCTPTE